MKKKIVVRVDVELLDELTKKYPDIKGYTYAEKVNILLQKLWRGNFENIRAYIWDLKQSIKKHEWEEAMKIIEEMEKEGF